MDKGISFRVQENSEGLGNREDRVLSMESRLDQTTVVFEHLSVGLRTYWAKRYSLCRKINYLGWGEMCKGTLHGVNFAPSAKKGVLVKKAVERLLRGGHIW